MTINKCSSYKDSDPCELKDKRILAVELDHNPVIPFCDTSKLQIKNLICLSVTNLEFSAAKISVIFKMLGPH